MDALDLKNEIEHCLKRRHDYQDVCGKFPFRENLINLKIDNDGDLVWSLWGGEIVFHNFDSSGGGSWYWNDTSGG